MCNNNLFIHIDLNTCASLVKFIITWLTIALLFSSFNYLEVSDYINENYSSLIGIALRY